MKYIIIRVTIKTMEQNCYRKGGDEGEEIESKFILKKNIKSDRDKKNKAFNTKFNTKG